MLQRRVQVQLEKREKFNTCWKSSASGDLPVAIVSPESRAGFRVTVHEVQGGVRRDNPGPGHVSGSQIWTKLISLSPLCLILCANEWFKFHTSLKCFSIARSLSPGWVTSFLLSLSVRSIVESFALLKNWVTLHTSLFYGQLATEESRGKRVEDNFLFPV